MSRLYDRLMTEGVQPCPLSPTQEHYYWGTLKEASRLLEDATVFSVENVNEYFSKHPPEEGWVLEDFPALAPPLPTLFMESRAIHHPLARIGGRHLASLPPLHSWGVLFHGWDVREHPEYRRTRRGDAPGRHPIDDPELRWGVDGFLYLEPRKGEIYGPAIWFQYGVKEDGSFVEGSAGTPYFSLSNPLISPRILGIPPSLGPSGHLLQFAHPFFFATSLMHCNNVRSEEVDEPAALRRKYQKRHGRELVRYHVLQIGPMQDVLTREGKAEETGLKKAMHICRGHFARYGIEGRGKLFGKYSGRFWKPNHLRGSREEGVVLKDYQMRTP